VLIQHLLNLNPKIKNSTFEINKFSIIIPVFNRPEEVRELLQSLTGQTQKNFEVIIIEDGSKDKSDKIIEEFDNQLDIQYLYKKNSGPGPSRNFGMKHAKGDFFIILDSDVILPSAYIKTVEEYLKKNPVDAYGGPDAAHPDFTALQKAIDFAMTSFLTTGGIRGKAEKLEKFRPRSFNMGISKKVFQKTGGFSNMRFGEDMDLSIRIITDGFQTALIKEAFVYHKRRNTLKQFFKQIFNSGIARIHLYQKHPKSLKIVHFFPLLFILGLISSLILLIFSIPYVFWIYILYFLLIFIFSSIQYRSIKTGLISVLTSLEMLWAYASGFLYGIWKIFIRKQKKFHKFEKNFYE